MSTTWNNDSARQVERESIRLFVQKHRALLAGRVLDFGAGKQPYRDLFDPAADYLPLEQGEPRPTGRQFDAVLCTQVMQYIERPLGLLDYFRQVVKFNGSLIMTYGTNWPEVEASDLFRYTKSGMTLLLAQTGWSVRDHQLRAEINLNGFRLAMGYGVVAQNWGTR